MTLAGLCTKLDVLIFLSVNSQMKVRVHFMCTILALELEVTIFPNFLHRHVLVSLDARTGSVRPWIVTRDYYGMQTS